MIDRPVDIKELQEMVKDQSFVFIVGMLQPRRPGVHIFNTLLEYNHYTPMTPANDDYIPIQMKWPPDEKPPFQMMWWVARIPAKDMHIAKQVAATSPIPMRIADGIPHVIGAGGVQKFPLNSPNVFTLEYAEQQTKTQEQLGAIEDREVEAAWERQKQWLIANGHGDLAHDGDHEEKIIGEPNLLLIVENFDVKKLPDPNDVKFAILGDWKRALDIEEEYLRSSEKPTLDGFITALGKAGGFRSPKQEEIINSKYRVLPIPWDLKTRFSFEDSHWAFLNPKKRHRT